MCDTVEKLLDSLRSNFANRSLYYAALTNSINPISFNDLAEILQDVPTPATCTTRPRNAITNLVNRGALTQSAYVDGQLYEGTIDELQSDDSITAETTVEYFVQSTDAGKALLEAMQPATQIDRLLTDNPEFAREFLATIALCASGVEKSRIETYFKDDPEALRPDKRTGLPTVSVSYFTSSLEDAGALIWKDGIWKATEAGLKTLARWNWSTNE